MTMLTLCTSLMHLAEGLPLAVSLALAFATTRMTKQNLLVRVLASCETMGTATVVCTDKTGTLTTNRMTVVAGAIGVHLKFAKTLEENQSRINATGKDFVRDSTKINECLPEDVKVLLNDSIAINSSAYEDEDPQTHEIVFTGNKTETALLGFAKNAGWEDYAAVRARAGANKIDEYPFSSARKSMATVIKVGNIYRVYLKGASEILFGKVVNHIAVSESAGQSGIQTEKFDEESRRNVDDTIQFYASQSLRTMAFCYKDFESWPPAEPVDGQVPFEALAEDLTLIAIMAIEDPLRDGVTNAVKMSQGAGVAVKMCTGDNVLTAR